MTPAELLQREISRDGARPFLTWYDDSASARIELSVATTANWVAKIAGWLTDEYDVSPGDLVTVALPLHWQTPCVLLAVWTCGGTVSLDPDAQLTIGTAPPADVVVEPDPMGMGLSRLVAAQPDQFVAGSPPDPSQLALRTGDRAWTHGELAAAAAHTAARHRIDRLSRVLSTLAFDTVDGIDAGLLAPLSAGGSVVLVSNRDDDALPDRCATERVTHTAGVKVPGIARLD